MLRDGALPPTFSLSLAVPGRRPMAARARLPSGFSERPEPRGAPRLPGTGVWQGALRRPPPGARRHRAWGKSGYTPGSYIDGRRCV